VRLLQQAAKVAAKTVLSNNFAFGGMNTCLIFSKV
jgi:3-oxoacyl-(acyl-carrier-protein) synthase